jgi:hypothetical protein
MLKDIQKLTGRVLKTAVGFWVLRDSEDCTRVLKLQDLEDCGQVLPF